MQEYQRKLLVKRELKGIYTSLNNLLDDALSSLVNMRKTLTYFKVKNKKFSTEEQQYMDKFILDIEEISTKTEKVLNNIDEIPNRESLLSKLEYVRKEFSKCKTQIDYV